MSRLDYLNRNLVNYVAKIITNTVCYKLATYSSFVQEGPWKQSVCEVSSKRLLVRSDTADPWGTGG